MSGLGSISQLDYTVVFARDLPRMRRFYEQVMRFPVRREVGAAWIEYRVGSNVLALTQRGMMFDDAPPPDGALALQLAFRVPPLDVDRCAAELMAQGIDIVAPPQDQPWGHRTLFFRDPDGNVIEIYADI